MPFTTAAPVKAGPTHIGAGWSSPVARQAHNLKVVGSNPTPATTSCHRRENPNPNQAFPSQAFRTKPFRTKPWLAPAAPLLAKSNRRIAGFAVRDRGNPRQMLDAMVIYRKGTPCRK